MSSSPALDLKGPSEVLSVGGDTGVASVKGSQRPAAVLHQGTLGMNSPF